MPVVVAGCYFGAAKLGEALAFPSAPVSALWAPNAILMAALLLTDSRRWPTYLLAALPLHLVAQLPGFPLSQAILHYLANAGIAVLGALVLRTFCAEPLRFNRIRTAFVLIVFGGVLGPAVTSIFMAGAFLAVGISREFWLTVAAGTLTNTFAIVVLVPLIVHVAMGLRGHHEPPPLSRLLEAASLAGLLIAACVLVFVVPEGNSRHTPTLLYVPMPLLAWAAIRFGVTGACASALLIGAVSTLGILNGNGPYIGADPVENALSVVAFQVVGCITLVLFAALLDEWRAAERARAGSEARFRGIFENNPVPTVIFDDALRIREANDAFMRLTGLDARDIARGRSTFRDLASGMNPLEYAANTQPVAEPLPAFTRCERELALRDGRRVPVLLSHCRFPADEGSILYALDLSEFRRAEAGRRSVEGLHAAVLASLHDEVAVLDRSGTVIEVNDSWRQAVGTLNPHRQDRILAGDNFIEKCGRAATNGDLGAEEHLRAVRAVLDGSQIRCQFEYREQRRGEQAYVEVSIERLRRPDGGAVVTRTDITARKRAEQEALNQRQQLTHLSRAAVLGQLSGAFAHELNQPLTSILGNAEAALQMLRGMPDAPRELGEILRDIVQDDERAAQIIRRLRALLGKGETARAPVDLGTVVRDSLSLTHSEIIARNIRVETNLDLECPLVLGDRVQLQQVLLNLVMNACEAMEAVPPASRLIVVGTRYRSVDATVELSVRDQGCGIPPEDLELIFQPFVSRKSKGLGLGLAICRSVVESHHGRLWADNADGGGAIFYLKVPLDGGPS